MAALRFLSAPGRSIGVSGRRPRNHKKSANHSRLFSQSSPPFYRDWSISYGLRLPASIADIYRHTPRRFRDSCLPQQAPAGGEAPQSRFAIFADALAPASRNRVAVEIIRTHVSYRRASPSTGEPFSSRGESSATTRFPRARIPCANRRRDNVRVATEGKWPPPRLPRCSTSLWAETGTSCPTRSPRNSIGRIPR